MSTKHSPTAPRTSEEGPSDARVARALAIVMRAGLRALAEQMAREQAALVPEEQEAA